MPPSRNLQRSSIVTRGSILAAAFAAITFLTGGHCGNEVTAPLETPTPAPSPTPAPASLSGGIGIAHSLGFLQGAAIEVRQGSVLKTATTDRNGHFEIDGLQAGGASVAVSALHCEGHQDAITLVPGTNSYTTNLVCPPGL